MWCLTDTPIHGLSACGIPETVTHPSTNRGGRCHAANGIYTRIALITVSPIGKDHNLVAAVKEIKLTVEK
jgi:hypothetical protein